MRSRDLFQQIEWEKGFDTFTTNNNHGRVSSFGSAALALSCLKDASCGICWPMPILLHPLPTASTASHLPPSHSKGSQKSLAHLTDTFYGNVAQQGPATGAHCFPLSRSAPGKDLLTSNLRAVFGMLRQLEFDINVSFYGWSNTLLYFKLSKYALKLQASALLWDSHRLNVDLGLSFWLLMKIHFDLTWFNPIKHLFQYKLSHCPWKLSTLFYEILIY